jgi:FkbM family methyltransferase
MNMALNYLSFVGLGVDDYDLRKNIQDSEISFLRSLSKIVEDGDQIVDVGANVGDYAIAVRNILGPKVRIAAIEPSPKIHKVLAETAKDFKFESYCLGCGSKKSVSRLYDRDISGTQHGSLYEGVFRQGVFRGIPKNKIISIKVNLDTIDHLAERFHWAKIRLLKIDTEGHELEVLKGARKLLRRKAIDYIQFEFNEMNLVSGVHMREIKDFLSGFELFRMLPHGLLPLNKLNPVQQETFGYQNLVAVRDGLLKHI